MSELYLVFYRSFSQKNDPGQTLQKFYGSLQDAEYTKVLETSITSSLRPTTLEKCISRQKAVKNNGRNSEDSRGGVKRQNETTVLSKKEDRANGATSGSVQI